MDDHRKMIFASIVFVSSFWTCAAQREKLVVMFVNEDGNSVAEEAYKAVLKCAREKFKYEIDDTYRAAGSGPDAEMFLDALCSAYNTSIEKGTPPHLILDMTRNDIPSETTKSFTKLLGLPTITGSFGQDGDLRQWRNLNDKVEKYLIQVNPPADMLTEVVRPIVNQQNISNAGILFDDSIVMDHKYKSLLQNVPTRHLINKQEENVQDQLTRFKSLGLFNYFIIGSHDTIKAALDAGDALGYFDRNFAWHTISMDAGTPTTNCTNCTFLHVRPVHIEKPKELFQKYVDDFQLPDTPPVEASFYFDLMLFGIMAAKALKDKGAYSSFGEYTPCNSYEARMDISRKLDLREEFRTIVETQPTSYAEFSTALNGFSWQQFSTTLQRIIFRNGKMKNYPAEVATWLAGINTTLDVKDEKKLKNMSDVTVYPIVTLEINSTEMETPQELVHGEEVRNIWKRWRRSAGK